MKTKFEVAADDDGLRLDQVIPKHVAGLSRRKARAVIDLGGVFVDRARVKVAGRLVKRGQFIEVNVGGALERANETPLAPRIVHTDEHIIVVDKPAGLVTAPTPESNRGDLLDQLAKQFGEVYLVHRLDLPTSGLLVFARTRDANKRLGDAFKVHDVDREYRAVAVGGITAQTIDREIEGRRAVTHVEQLEAFPRITPDGSPIVETNADGTPIVETNADGTPVVETNADGTAVDAPNDVPVVATSGDVPPVIVTKPTPVIATHATLLRVRLETGRTHQIRLHLAGLGHPVCGDRTHGGEKERAFLPRPPRLALHAMVLGFAHPATNERMRWEAPLPDDLSAWISRLRRK